MVQKTKEINVINIINKVGRAKQEVYKGKDVIAHKILESVLEDLVSLDSYLKELNAGIIIRN